MKRFKAFVSKHKKPIIIISIILVAVLGAAYAFGFFDKKVSREAEDQQKKYYSKLTGVETERDLAQRPVLGIMIENSEQARPQTGLDSAGIVFETVTEGGITRYLALFQEDQPVEVGPVRSIRPYFVDWAMGFDVSIAHVGGSAEALGLVEDRPEAKSLNQFTFSNPYFRVSNRAAPHNMYARTQDLRDLQQAEGQVKSEFKEIPRSDDSPASTADATKITIDFSRPTFLVEFIYDPTSNSYTRHLAGKPHLDAETNQPITVKNIVVLKMSTGQIDATSEGEALVFKNGTVQTGKFKQTSYKTRVEITDAEGNQIPLNRGDTWFTALPAGRPIKY